METVDLNFRFNATGNAVPELRKAQNAVKRLDGQIQQSNARMRGFNNGITTMQANTRKFSMGALQQAGYQVGDYAVQVANGTSKMQAFGQQAPQFLQIFGPIGAVVGAGVAIFAALGVAIERSGSAAKQSVNSFMTLDQVNLGSIRSAVSDLESIQNRYNDAISASGGASTGAARLVVSNSETEFNARKKLLGVERELLSLRSQDQISALENLREQQDRTRAALQEQLRNLGPGATAARGEGSGGFAGQGATLEEITKAGGAYFEQLRNNRREILQLEAELARLGIASDEAAAAMDMVFGVDAPDALGGGSGGASGAERSVRGIASAVNDELSPALQRLQTIQSTVSKSLESGLMSIVDGTKSVKEAFKSMASEIIKELYRIFVVKQITGMIANAIGGIGGAPTTSPRPIARPAGFRAMGGQVTGGKAYMVGERGPEMVVPSRNAHVVPNNQMGGGGVTVNQNITFGSGVSRAEVNAMIPKIVEATKAAVADAKLRGGSYGRSFA